MPGWPRFTHEFSAEPSFQTHPNAAVQAFDTIGCPFGCPFGSGAAVTALQSDIDHLLDEQSESFQLADELKQQLRTFRG